MKLLLYCTLILAWGYCCVAQEPSHTKNEEDGVLVVNDIIIFGNKKTKNHIITRELDFQQGDTLQLQDTSAVLKHSKNKIFNTGLFNKVNIKTVDTGEDGTIVTIHVAERWYIFPIPVLDVGDRNFNEWWQQRGRGLERLEYGIHFKHKNFRGRNEKLEMKVLAGFTNKYELFYTIPYIDENQKSGVKMDVSYSTNRFAAARTKDHQLDFYTGDRPLKKRFFTGLNYLYRNDFYVTHRFGLYMHANEVADTIALVNPDYFLDGRTSQRYFKFVYHLEDDHTDIQFYPMEGYRASLHFEKEGFGILGDLNMWELEGSIAFYDKWNHGLSWATRLSARTSYPVRQPYFNVQGESLGYEENLVRGYELYVIDGQHYVLNRTEMRWKLFEIENFENKLMPIQQFRNIPLAVFLKAHNDVGYVVDQSDNPLNQHLSNELMWGYGLGIDFTTYYDVVVRAEVSVNRLNEIGFFLHMDAGI